MRTEPQPDDLGPFYPPDRYYGYRAPEARPLTRAAVRRTYGLRTPAVGSSGLLRRSPAGASAACRPGRQATCWTWVVARARSSSRSRVPGWRCSGVEMYPGAVEAAREAALERVREGDLLEAGYPDSSTQAYMKPRSACHSG